ncbi:MAG: hypothetical protein M0P71_11390 [Melioribacteraceae bacterium]|nr:hypothetical protein [Melioribacteraceae bacterium]
MSIKSEPWYLHAGLYAVILVLIYVLIRVAILEPQEVVENEKYYKAESRARMLNIREGEKLWFNKYNRFTDSMDSLVNFLKTDPSVQKAITGTDSITGRPTNTFVSLKNGEELWDSLFKSPKSGMAFILEVDTSKSADTVIDRRGNVIKVDSSTVIGKRYVVRCPDGYGAVGDLYSDAMRYTASWE